MATSNEQQQYAEQLRVLQERFPNAPQGKLNRLLQRFNGDVDQVGARLFQRDFHANKLTSLEERYGETVKALQREYPAIEGFRRVRLLKIIERFGGDIEQVRQFLQKVEERHQNRGHGCRHHGHHRGHHHGHHRGHHHDRDDSQHHDRDDSHHHGRDHSRHQRREELQTKYASQLAELSSAGINTNGPWILRLLERKQGDTNKVIEIVTRRKENKEKFDDLETKYASQIAELEAAGVEIKNRRVLARLLQKADGQVDVAKQFINERKEKHRQRKEYCQRHRSKSPNQATEENDASCNRKRRGLSSDDWEKLKQLRSAGVRGNPMKVLKVFHECNDSIELTIARTQEEREKRDRNREERCLKRSLLQEVHNAYLTINNREDWPENIEQVYLDGNNMMFVVDSLRRLCLNRAGQKTERAIGEIASAWNEKMHIPNVDLVFDSTRQLEPIGTVKVSSAQPKYQTTDDMFVEIARRPENQEKNKRTIVVTSDRALASLLQREGCLLVKPYNWFAHCVMVLSPDLVNYEEITGMTTTTASPTAVKTRYNFDQLVQRFANIDL